MRVNIIGLTDCTINFNTLGIVLHGKETARSIEIKTDGQLRELVSLKNSLLVSFVSDEPVPQLKISTELPPPVEKVLDNSVANFKKGVVSAPIAVKPLSEEIEEPEDNNKFGKAYDALKGKVLRAEEVEDAPTKSGKTIAAKKGRPKGSLNKKTLKQLAKQEAVNPVVAPAAVPVVAPAPAKVIAPPVNTDTDNDVVVMTPSGPVKGKATRSVVRDLPESEATRASIEALQKMEEEERGEDASDTPVDESHLDASERMGGPATIVTGSRQTESVAMKNSILPQAEQIRKADAFIDAKEAKPDTAKTAFIDKVDGDDDEKLSDAFIEM